MNLIHADGLSIWNVPRLTTDGHDEDPDTKVPLFFIPYPSESASTEYEGGSAAAHFSGLCDWYTGSDQPLWFDYQHTYHPETLRSFLLETTSLVGLRLEPPSLGGFSTIHLPETCFSEALASRVAGGKQVRMFGTDTGLVCHSVQDIGGLAQDSFLKIDLFEDAEYSKTFCPFSGRFCYSTRIFLASSVTIRVLDFFV